MKAFYIMFIICSCLICGCKQRSPTEEEFLNYLQSQHVTPQENSVYLFVPSSQCIGCVMLNAASLDDAQNNRTFIFSNLTQQHFLNFKNYHYDKEDKVSGLKLVGFENALVYYKNGRILFRMSLNIRRMDIQKNCGNNPH